jgi:plasmid stabilization system protein ParE
MRWKFHPEAAEDYLAACRYYTQIERRLGSAFVQAVETAVGQIINYPQAGQEIEEDVHRHLLTRFPFGIYYTMEKDFILIVALLHMKREPGYWRTRLP